MSVDPVSVKPDFTVYRKLTYLQICLLLLKKSFVNKYVSFVLYALFENKVS